jgi:hypothetical protein
MRGWSQKIKGKFSDKNDALGFSWKTKFKNSIKN